MTEPRNQRLPTVTVDIGPLLEDHWTGIPVFTRRLVQALMRDGSVDVEFSFRLTQIPKEAVLAAIRVGSGTLLRSEFERNAGRNYPLIDPKSNLLFPSVKECFNVARREASTIHDVSPLVMPEYHEQENIDHHMRNMARQLATDDVVFCASEATRAALTLMFPSVAGKAQVLPQYVDWPEQFPVIERNLPAPVLGKYVVVIGTIEPRKNLALLLQALAMPEVRDSAIKFVVIGKKGWKVDQFLEELTPHEREHILFSGFVTEFMKYRLLRHAEFLVFPSIYEGFGIPALEAMSLGKPVLAAMTSSFPEIVAEAGLYFDPFSTAEFAAAFKEISSERKLSELGPKARHRASSFRWEEMVGPVVRWASGE